MTMQTMRSAGLAILAAACVASVAYARTLAGSGEWQSLGTPAVKGTWKAQLVRQGTEVKGNIDLDGSNVLSGGSVTGQIDGTGVTFGVMVDGARRATFSGKLQGGVVSGEWKLESDELDDHGVWRGTLEEAKPTAGGAS